MPRSVALLAAALLAGCGGPEPVFVPVTGKVTLAGKPVTAARVLFVPDRENGNADGEEARARVDADGGFALATGDRPGVRPGWYKVAVFAFDDSGAENGAKPPVWLAPVRYSDVKTSGLAVEVAPGMPAGAADLALKP